jgi:membrane protease YdiL (CAAX protease family)
VKSVTTAGRNPQRIAAWILAVIAVTEGSWIVANLFPSPGRLLSYLGFGPAATAGWLGWAAAALVAATYVWVSADRLPAVRENLLRPTLLKALAVVAALTAGVLEEVVFRKWLMDALQRHEMGALGQVLLSGLAFGLAHGVWGLMGRSLRAASGATIATGLLGAALALVYLLSGRNLAPCVAAHVLISALIEPGLVLAATRGEMGAPFGSRRTGAY